MMVFRAATRPVFLVLNANEESALEAAQIKPVQRDGGVRMSHLTQVMINDVEFIIWYKQYQQQEERERKEDRGQVC